MAPGYFSQLLALVRTSCVALLRPPAHPKNGQALRPAMRQTLWLAAIGALSIVALMIWVDAWEIGLMPPRGTPGLWPFRILTDFGKDAYVLGLLFATLILITLAVPATRDGAREKLLKLGGRVGFVFLAVQVPVIIAEILKWAVGRGRPFVGGKANAFNFAPFTGSEAYFSFPSAHAITAFALVFAVGAIWPRARAVMLAYAVLIAITRLVLLSHYPSDVVAGGVIGVTGAIWVRYWFASRGLGFTTVRDGKLVSRF